MKKEFLPVLLGSDFNVYAISRAFFQDYNIKPLAICAKRLYDTKYSKILNVIDYENFNNSKVFVKKLIEIGKKYKKENKKLFLIGCNDTYVKLVIDNKKSLQKYYILPFINKKKRDTLDNKESFYKICDKYGLEYPKTYICTLKNYKKIKLPFDFPVAVKVSNSVEYVKLDFEGKKKGYKAENQEELEKIVYLIYSAGYKSNIIIQDFIPGDDTSMYVLNSYSDKNGKVKMMSLGHVILEEYTPKGIGNYYAIISDYNKKLYDKYKKFLEDIKYIGYSNFDFKLDSRDNKFKVFEINIRLGRSSFYTTASGYNIIKYLIDDYIYDKNEDTIYCDNKHLWIAVWKKTLLKYIKDDKIKKEVKKLFKEKKYSYTYFYKKDISIIRLLVVNYLYYINYKLLKMYYGKRGLK